MVSTRQPKISWQPKYFGTYKTLYIAQSYRIMPAEPIEQDRGPPCIRRTRRQFSVRSNVATAEKSFGRKFSEPPGAAANFASRCSSIAARRHVGCAFRTSRNATLRRCDDAPGVRARGASSYATLSLSEQGDSEGPGSLGASFLYLFIFIHKPCFPIRDSRPPSVLELKNETLRPARAAPADNVGSSQMSSPPCQGPRVKDDHSQTSHAQPSRNQTDFMLGKPDISEAAPGSGP